MNKSSKQSSQQNQPRRAGLTCFSDARGAEALSELRGLRDRRGGRTVPDFEKMLGSLPRYKEEGHDHINVSKASVTEVGRMFSLEDDLPYHDSILDTRIESLRIFTFFLKTGMTDARLLVRHAMPFGTRLEHKHVRNVFALQAHAIWEKLRAYGPMQEVLMSLNVPLDWYMHGHSGARSRTVTGAAYVAALRVIKEALTEGKSPDFTDFFDLDVQDSLRQMESGERKLEIERLLQESLNPVRDAIRAIRADREAAKKERQLKQRVTQQKPQQRDDVQRPQGDSKKRPQRQKKPHVPGVPSLNHMMPSSGQQNEAAAASEAGAVDSAPAVADVGGTFGEGLEVDMTLNAPGIALATKAAPGTMQLNQTAGEIHLDANALSSALLPITDVVAQVAEVAGNDAAAERYEAQATTG